MVTLDNLAGLGWERPVLGFSLAGSCFGFVASRSSRLHRQVLRFAAAYRHGGPGS